MPSHLQRPRVNSQRTSNLAVNLSAECALKRLDLVVENADVVFMLGSAASFVKLADLYILRPSLWTRVPCWERRWPSAQCDHGGGESGSVVRG